VLKHKREKFKIKEVMSIREYKGFVVDDDLNVYNARTGRKITPFVGSDGYYQVTRSRSDGSHYHLRLHVLYANLFIPNPNGYKYINHIDSNKLNYSLDNLEWCTNSYNVQHGWDSGNRTYKNNTKVQAEDIDGNKYIFDSIRKLGEALHLDRHKVARILKGEILNHYKYKFSYVM